MILLMLVIQSILSIVKVDGGDCLYYEFKKQPPHSLNCNPYITPIFQIFDLKIPCEVQRQSDNAGTFDIRWIKREFDGDMINLGRGKTISQDKDLISVELAFPQLLIGDSFSFKLSGDYWCQVINTTTTPHTYLGTSNIMRILKLDTYLGDDEIENFCRGTKSDDSNICADISLMETYGSLLKISSVTSETTPATTTAFTNTIRLQTTGTIIDSSSSLLVSVAPTVMPSGTMLVEETNVIEETNFVENDTAKNNKSVLSEVAYIMIISLLVLIVSLLITVIAVVCHRRATRNKSNAVEDVNANEPQPYMEPIQTLRQTARIGRNSSRRQHNRIEATQPMNIYASLSVSTMEPQMEYAMVNSSLLSDEFINYEYFRGSELMNQK